MRENKGQNLIEYVMLVAAVLLVCIAFYTSGAMNKSVNSTLNGIGNLVNTINSQIQY